MSDSSKRGMFSRLFRRDGERPAREAMSPEHAEPASPEAPPSVADVAAGDAAPRAEGEPAPKRSWFERLRAGLARSSSSIGEGIGAIFLRRRLDATTLGELEDVLIQADLGVETATAI